MAKPQTRSPKANEERAGDEFIVNQRLSRVYAEALVSVADKHGQADEVEQELHGIVDYVILRDPRAGQLLMSKAISRQQKEPLLREAFEGKVTDTLLRFLLVLNQRDRLDQFRAIWVAYRNLLDERAKRVRVKVRTAIPLPEDQLQRLTDLLRGSLRLDPVLEISVEPSLLAGMIVRVGDEVYDSSVSTRVENIRNQLLSGRNHEIQAGRDRFSYSQANR